MAKELVVYLSHLKTDRIIKDFYRLQKTGGDRRTVFMYHKMNSIEMPDAAGFKDSENLPDSHYLFTTEILNRMMFPTLGDTMYGHVHFPLFEYYSKYCGKENDYIWFIEYDVAFTGEWNYLFDYFRESDADFIASHIETYDENPDWHRWKLEHPYDFIPKNKRVRSYNPIYRLSSQALEFLDKRFRDGWKGHNEVTFPTLLYNNGYELLDFGNRGAFTRKETENFYYSYPIRFFPSYVGTMRYRPVFKKAGMLKNTLYHPVKPETGRGRISAMRYYFRNIMS